jgi:hypothetical protein
MQYDNRIVLFLDILGFRKHVMDTIQKDKNSNELIDDEIKVKALYDTLSKMGDIAGVNGNQDKIKVTQFSDSIVISFVEDSPSNASTVFEIILKIITHLISQEIICRGALSYGKFIHDSRILFGPALVDAYETESKAAMYPRVIMDRKIYDYSRMHFDKKNENTYIPDGISDYLKLDLDGKYYLDYFSAAPRVIKDETEIISYYKTLREIIINGRRFEQPDLKVKYGWLRMKYNKFLDNLSQENTNPRTFNYLSKLKRLK